MEAVAEGVIRMDKMGSGEFGARRGYRVHTGRDELCIPGQPVHAPIRGRLTRALRVYAADDRWLGLEIVNAHLIVQIFYVDVLRAVIGKEIKKGQVIGHAQDISKKYDADMKPHVHVQAFINPSLLELL